jgi:hypothetical protein
LPALVLLRKPLSGLAKRRKQPERYAQCTLKLVGKYLKKLTEIIEDCIMKIIWRINMKPLENRFLYSILFFICFSQFCSCQSYREMEDIYQADADIIRIQHFDYYAQLLTEYHKKNGKYPLQYEKEAPVYVFILTDFQEKDFKDSTPYRHYTVNDRYFFEELSNGLDREIYEKYDPQKVGTDGRPNMYIYMVHGNSFYFAVHFYAENPFTKNISRYYNKMELSNEDDKEYSLYTYETLKNDQMYLELINAKAAKQGFFDELDEQNKYNSKN